jgi:adenylate cyclase
MAFKILKNKLAKSLLVSFIVAIIVALLMTVGFLDTWESKISDAFYSPSSTDDDIVIVAIDDESFQELGMLPWPRSYYATVINNINQSSVIGIDIVFDLETNAENDSKLAESLKGANVVLAAEFTSFSFVDGEMYGTDLLKPNEALGTEGVDFNVGFVNLYLDSDGVIRSFAPQISGTGDIGDYEHFALATINKIPGVTRELESPRMLINFFGEPGDYTYYSFSDVYLGEVDLSEFDGKIALIGVTSPLEHDDYTVPISSQDMPGVEIHANLAQSILTKNYLSYQDALSTVVIILIFALLAGFLMFKFKIHIATILIAVIAIAYLFLSVIYSFSSGIIMNILYPLIAIVLVYIALVVIYYRTEEKSRKWITSVFGKYVSPVVIENLLKDPDKLNLGGEKRDITIFFSDIRGFTTISEKLAPEELVHLLNEYLTEMTSIIIKNQGLVDKYMGDAIMAFWGAPLEQPNHAELACLSSLEMMEKLKELQKKWKKEGIPSFDIGIGLNSGEAVVGNMGSSKRFDYTAMGDNVNLASRLEGLNKTYKTNIIISENTYKVVKDKFKTRKLGRVTVKGKKRAITIYELLARKK